jgi:hypothetical protein
MAWIGPVIGAVGSLVGSGVSNSASRSNAQRADYFSERMSNTAYQRAMADMRRSGLNPILAAKLGPASSPTGTNAPVFDYGQSFASGAATGMQLSKLEPEIEKLESEQEKIEQEVKNLGKQYELTDWQIWNVMALTNQAKTQAELNRQQGHSVEMDNVIKQVITDYKKENPGKTIAQAFGIDGATLLSSLGQILSIFKVSRSTNTSTNSSTNTNYNFRSTFQ